MVSVGEVDERWTEKDEQRLPQRGERTAVKGGVERGKKYTRTRWRRQFSFGSGLNKNTRKRKKKERNSRAQREKQRSMAGMVPGEIQSSRGL